MGEPKKKNVDRSYTLPEIKSMLDIADLRFKVVISVLASTGIRIGGFAPLKLSHLKKKGDVYKFIIYENSKDEYFTFCSLECSSYNDAYLEYRSRSGERLGPDSYLIREQFDINDFEQIRKEGRPISKDSISNILHSLTIKAGLRTINHNAKYTHAERALVKSIIASLTIKRIPEAEIIRAIFDQTNKTLSKSGLFRIKQAIKRDSYKWYKTMREGEYEYIHEFKERINEILFLQTKHHEIVENNSANPQIQQTSLAELHRLTITYQTYMT